ncbi:tRNA (adenosine(37)-N6)-threonylcarbamoyltransferase complex ATPase subunit type 1 TsaE [bacterium]|nr:tRNA (adenosine(37)-N6)-threonylcarbamoyltransferase complex ATPase subunit type 1 TsaE [bacterium]
MDPNYMGELISHSPEETVSHGKAMGENCAKSMVLLFGDLGTGKTLWTKGFAKGLLILSDVYSPSYTILNRYKDGGKKLYHFDLYRINYMEELVDIGLLEILDEGFPVVIEWPERFPELKKWPHLSVTLLENGPNSRKIFWEFNG